MAYPGVLEEFVDTLNWLRITHEERSLLEDIIHLEMPTNTISHTSTIPKPRNVSVSSTLGQSSHCRHGSVSKRYRQINNATVGGTGIHPGQERRSVNQWRRDMTGKQVRATARASPLLPGSSKFFAEEGHLAFTVPWQSADLPLLVNEAGSQTPATTEECEESGQSGSSAATDHSTPSEHDTEEIEGFHHDFIKIPWSDNATE